MSTTPTPTPLDSAIAAVQAAEAAYLTTQGEVAAAQATIANAVTTTTAYNEALQALSAAALAAVVPTTPPASA